MKIVEGQSLRWKGEIPKFAIAECSATFEVSPINLPYLYMSVDAAWFFGDARLDIATLRDGVERAIREAYKNR